MPSGRKERLRTFAAESGTVFAVLSYACSKNRRFALHQQLSQGISSGISSPFLYRMLQCCGEWIANFTLTVRNCVKQIRCLGDQLFSRSAKLALTGNQNAARRICRIAPGPCTQVSVKYAGTGNTVTVRINQTPDVVALCRSSR